MDFGLSEDQKLLQRSVTRLLDDRAPIARIRALRDEGVRNDRDLWNALSALGAAGVLIPEHQGGSGLCLLDAALVCETLGRRVSPTAYLAAAVMAPVALREAALGESEGWLSAIARGEQVFGVACTEVFSIREGAGVRLESGKLHGKSLMALDVSTADRVLVTVGADRLAVIPAAAPGLTVTPLTTVDATRCTSELLLDGVEPEALAEDAREAIGRMLDAGRIALSADALGAQEAMIERAVAHALEREQFGRPIGSFQAVKHMCAEMVAELEPARSLMWYAAHCFDALPAEAPQMACHALAHISEIGRDIASIATQVHGGIGWTDEMNLHFWFKRIATARPLLGGPEYLRARAAALQGLVA